MRRRLCLGVLLSLPLVLRAQPNELAGWRLQGQAQMRFLGLLIYDARLWTRKEPVTAQDWATQDLALELEYARSLSGKEIAKRSLVEMRRQGEIDEARAARWLAEMEAAFPDVRAGDRISGVLEAGTALQFFVNGQARRRIADADFSRLFIGIWLAPQSSEPRLRQQLLEGGGCRPLSSRRGPALRRPRLRARLRGAAAVCEPARPLRRAVRRAAGLARRAAAAGAAARCAGRSLDRPLLRSLAECRARPPCSA